MSSWARIGVKCVVVDAEPMPGAVVSGKLPPKGTVVTISGFTDRLANWGPGTAVTIRGYPNQRLATGVDAGWRLERFRPLIPAKTQAQDVALFKSLLTPAPELVE